MTARARKRDLVVILFLGAAAASGRAPLAAGSQRGAQTAVGSDVARLCGQKGKLVRIARKSVDGGAEGDDREAFASISADGTETGFLLDRRVDLNGDGTPEVVLSDPDQIARDAQYLSWFLDCGGGFFYGLLTEYAGSYALGRAGRNGWRQLDLSNNVSSEMPPPNVVSKTTYQFNGDGYVAGKTVKLKRRPF